MPLDTRTVAAGVSNLTRQAEFPKWYAQQKPRDGDLVVINNSFVFRDLNTTKARYYLVLKVGSTGKPKKDVFVAEGMSINSNFRLFPSRDPRLMNLIPLAKAVAP